MEYCDSQREAVVARVNADNISIHLLEPADSRACSGCALAFTCKKHEGKELIVDAFRPHNPSDISLTVGCRVLAEPLPGVRRKAVFLLLILPLLALIAVAVVATLFGVEQGSVALLSLGAAAAVYVVAYFYGKSHRIPVWRIVAVEENNCLTL